MCVKPSPFAKGNSDESIHFLDLVPTWLTQGSTLEMPGSHGRWRNRRWLSYLHGLDLEFKQCVTVPGVCKLKVQSAKAYSKYFNPSIFY